MNAASRGLKNCVAPEVSVQPQGKESHVLYRISKKRKDLVEEQEKLQRRSETSACCGASCVISD